MPAPPSTPPPTLPSRASSAASGALIKTGEHRLTLTGNNTYRGGTAINAGTLRIGDGGTSGSIQGNVANNGLLAFDRSDSLTYSGIVSGSGGLAKFGAGTLILTGNSTYTGGTTINAGTLQIGNGGAGGSILGDITNNGTLAVDSASNLALTGVIAGSGALTKIGTGTLALGGNNSYAGGTSVSQGTLAISSDGNLGAPSGGLTLNGGELLPTASVATARAITLGPGGGSFFTPGGVTLSASGVVSGPGALTLAGGGTLSLGGINTYTGPTTVNAGALIVNGSIASSSLLSVDPRGLGGRHRHPALDRDQRRPAGARQLDRHAERARQLHAERRHLPGRALAQARPTASTSAAAPPSTAAPCSSSPSRAATPTARPTRSSMPPAASAVPTPTSSRTSPS